ncbi:MAG: metallophosphoesterase [Actinomycetota bacterium]|nr:metallophosphoesterase [Actinomycetota bacterium]
MVRWLDPGQLLDTSARVLASGLLTSYTDSRELQALVAGGVFDRSERGELWLDYVADLGDGFNSTYTVARLLARQHLDFGEPDQGHQTQRGTILVMGGDQVYPVPTRSNYENRLLGPYRAARPSLGAEAPDLFAIPGSHDWYDGLVNFSNVFCRQRSIGGWTTCQTRSYFALRLPHRWWLWGVDMQFGDYFDEAQLAYFADAAQRMERGDRIIVCMAKEVESGRKSAEVSSDRNLGYLEREVVLPAGASVALYLKSGRHHYCRYQDQDSSSQLITAGGGGAFLHPTHDLPERADAPGDGGAGTFELAAVYPSRAASKRLRKRVWLLPAFNLPLAAVLGGIQLLVVFMLGLHLHNRHRSVGFADLGRALWDSPTAFLLIIFVIATFGAMIRLAHDAKGLPRLLIGLGHSMLQFGGLAAVIVAASALSTPLGDGPAGLVAFLALVWVLGGVGGALGISGYLWATNTLGYHGNEAFAPLHHQDQKNFLRLHIDTHGTLTIYPVGIERICRRWRYCPDADAGSPWLAPDGPEPKAHLIEAPITFGREDRGADRALGGGSPP